MNITLITPITPYKENLRGTSGIQYHLLTERPIDINVSIYTFNLNDLTDEQINNVEKELNVRIIIMPKPKFREWILKWHLMFIRIFLRYPITYYIGVKAQFVKEIKESQPDGIWIYLEESVRISKQFKEFKRVHTLPDAESMYYYRMMQQKFVRENKLLYLRQKIMYNKYVALEKAFDSSSNIHYHLVGEEDVKFLKTHNHKIQAYFLRHPHYEVAEPQKVIAFSKPKIKLLIAGRNNIYMHQSATELVNALIEDKLNNSTEIDLTKHYIITFLGKDWENEVEELKNAGYEVNHIKFAPNYIEEVCKHDIQITPISIGTGTKGKVLDALANGLMVIGTHYAMENIAVKNGESCIEYQDAKEVIDVLKEIPNNIHIYETIAANGRNSVLKYHNRNLSTIELFSHFQ